MAFGAVGLVQNLAALRSIATEGITQGHLKLRDYNLARAAGAQGKEIRQVAKRMMLNPKRTVRQAEIKLAKMREGEAFEDNEDGNE